MARERVFIVVGAFAAMVLQLCVAPYIAVLSVVPNFVVAFAVVVASLRPQGHTALLPFLLGLAFDLAGGGPVGAMAFSLTLFCCALAWYCERSGNDSVFMSCVFGALGLLLVELTYGMMLLLFGYQAGLLEALAYRVAPCFAYDFAVALLIYPLARRFFRSPQAVRTDITQLR